MPSWAVTVTLIMFVPTRRFMRPEALPDTTVMPFTVTLAVTSATVGATVRLLTLFGTVAV